MAVSIGVCQPGGSVQPGPSISASHPQRLCPLTGRVRFRASGVGPGWLAWFQKVAAHGGHAFDRRQGTQPGDQWLRAGRADRGVTDTGLATAAGGNPSALGLQGCIPPRRGLDGDGRAGVELLHPVDGAHGDTEPEMGPGDLCPQRGDLHAGRGDAAHGAVRPAGPAAALQVQPPVAQHHQRRVPVVQPDPRQHLLVPGQRLCGLDGLRGAHAVVLRQRLDPVGAVGLRMAVPVSSGGVHVPVVGHALLLHPTGCCTCAGSTTTSTTSITAT